MVGLFLSRLCGPPIFLINVSVKSINVEGFVFSIICFHENGCIESGPLFGLPLV